MAIIGSLVLCYIGMQPPSEQVLYLTIGLFVALAIFWFAFERNRFEGPPTGKRIAKLQKEIAEAEALLAKG